MDIDAKPNEVVVLYKYSNGQYERQLNETIELLLKRRLPPHRVLIVCPMGLESQVKDEYMLMNSAARERLLSVSNVTLAAFNHLGKFEASNFHQLHAQNAPWVLSNEDADAIVEAGINEIIETTGTRMLAPPGYVFRKPSENASRVFIRAGNMMKNPSALAVIFHAMARTLPFGIKRIYIDSFTILSIVLTYQRLMVDLANACGVKPDVPTITNFHSYSMSPELTFEVTNEYVILISATSSGGLASKLVKERHARRDRVFHLLVFSQNIRLKSRAVFFRNEEKQEASSDDSFQRVIMIPGEEFIASHGDTRTVDLKVSHFVPKERKIYKDPYYQDVFGVNLRTPGSYGGAFRPVSFQPSAKVGSKEFLGWLERQASIEIPASTTVAISADDQRSKKMAEYLVSRIPGAKANGLKVVTLAKLLRSKRAGQKIGKTGSVLIVCSDESDGETLLAVSQALRDKPHLHRHYVIGHLFPSSSRQFKRLRSNLRVSGKGSQYGWSVYCVTPLGDDSLHQSWLSERTFQYKQTEWPKRSHRLRDALHKRADNLNSACLKGDDLFLPRVDGTSLKLRDDSVLFDGEYESISQANVYVQVAAALQRARDRDLHDDKILPEDHCFQSNPFIDTVIDPDTFSRYNDGVIQASLLRAASASELNYSRDLKLSQNMLNIFKAVVDSRASDRGEAVLEFMFASFFKKLRFHENHFPLVESLIRSNSELKIVWQAFNSNAPF